MSLKDVSYKRTYRTGQDDLIEDFYIPSLEESISYDRAVGFFSSSVLDYIAEGLYTFILNGGKIRLICSVNLSKEDYLKIKKGYEERYLEEKLEEEIRNIEQKFVESDNIKNICWLIKEKKLDIKLCIRDIDEYNFSFIDSLKNFNSIYHEKMGIFRDKYGNKVVFSGSLNESALGWKYNFESFDVYISWNSFMEEWVKEKEIYFENLWSNNVKGATVINFPEGCKKRLIKISPLEPIIPKNELIKLEFNPRPCQLKAYQFFVDNNYNCLFEMATGSGKTKAALYSMKKIKRLWGILLILVPNLELVEQWEKEIKIFFRDALIIKCGSKYRGWHDMLLSVIKARIPKRTIVISVYNSARTNRAISKFKELSPEKFAVIFDEVHNAGSYENITILELKPKYRIGLSATPVRNFDKEGTELIKQYFNNNEYIYTISDAIKDGYLIEYEYHVLPVFLTESEWNNYIELSKKINKLIRLNKNNIKKKSKEKYDKQLKILLNERSNIIKTSYGKFNKFKELIKEIKDKRVLVYGETKEHLSDYCNFLSEENIDFYSFYGDTDLHTRKSILNNFKLGVKNILMSIKCLDEGIDIPECDCAVFLSSSTSERQFIQRRGRVLRKGINKSRAYIYDFITIPKYENEFEKKEAIKLIKKEYKRIRIIAKDAINGTQTKNKLEKLLDNYHLNFFRV